MAMVSLLGVCASLTFMCPPVGEMPDDAYDNAWKIWAAGPKQSPHPAPPGYDPSLHGQWQPPTPWPVTGIHGLVLADGRVMHYSYPSGGGDGSNARLWDPDTGLFEDVSFNVDLFCSGHSLLPDGRVFISGGNDYECDFQGRNPTHIFDPADMSWRFVQNMLDGRWYPSHTTLGDGRVIITSGLATDCETNGEMEIYTPGAGVEFVPEGHRYLQLYPRIHLLSSGKIAYVGPEHQSFTFELGDQWRYIGNTNRGWRSDGSSVLIPGRIDEIMIIGGSSGGVATDTVEVIDFKDADPQWTYTTPLHHARGHLDALILPDKTVFVMGGGTDSLYGEPVFVPELFDPETEQWLELPPYVYGRMYHSTTLLLPDGRVLITGQDSGESYFWGEIYEPPYLFRGPRPLVDAAPDRVVHGQTFTAETPNATQIADVAMLRLSSNTHSVNFEQRYVGLDFVVDGASAEGGGSLTVSMEPEANLAPPGHYMLFILDGQGVPSVATMVEVDQPSPGDLNLDGAVNTVDLLAMLSAWGPCGGCPPDLDEDGFVNVLDLLTLLANWG